MLAGSITTFSLTAQPRCRLLAAAALRRCRTVNRLAEELVSGFQQLCLHFSGAAQVQAEMSERVRACVRYQFSVFQPLNLWLGFAAGDAGHGVITAQVFLRAAYVLHPLRKSCRGRGKIRAAQGSSGKGEHFHRKLAGSDPIRSASPLPGRRRLQRGLLVLSRFRP